MKAAGSCGDVYESNIGEGSPYQLPRGLNAASQNGGILLAQNLN